VTHRDNMLGMKIPALFVSHGAPTLLSDPGETGDEWRKLGDKIQRPSAILVMSAHWTTTIPTISGTERPETIHDFYGFPSELYGRKYPAPGAPAMAQAAASELRKAGVDVLLDGRRGLDHGAWVPLSLMYPAADIPVAQLSLQSDKGPAWHIALGHALRPLRNQGVLIIGSGSITHNLAETFRHVPGTRPPNWMEEFCDWIAACINAGDLETLCLYREKAPHAARNHPTDEHLLPLFTVLGAADRIDSGKRLNHVMTYGMLAMDMWLFDAR
jgi:4,5-DOPA dioxygenase extradiol